jgi:steroid 5-alpha reductase family enzyme
MLDFWVIAGIGGALLAALFWGTLRLSARLDNYSFVDVTWALSFAPVAVWYGAASGGWWARRTAVAALVAGWSLRLGTHLWRRVAGHHPKEDARYAVLREKWRANLQGAFLKFFMMQAVLVWLLMLPVLLIAGRTDGVWHPLEVAGLVLWAAALIGEGVADAQLSRFKRVNRDPKGICEAGLWRYSRHPNYFFQSLLWWGLFLMAVPAEGGWWAILAPVAMLHFLLNVTGIPLTEKLSVEKRGEVYREYQRRTSAFVPWFRKAG